MPTINRLKRNPKPNTRTDNTDARELRRIAYNNSTWRKLRDTFLKNNAVCSVCLSHGRITASEDVHHKISPFKDGVINYALLLDENNLMALCKKCHGTLHSQQQGHKSPEEIIEELDNLLNGKD